jgi:tetratricopeptide (TPR) repeat protein
MMRALALSVALMAFIGAAAWGESQQEQGPVEKASEQNIGAVRDTIVDALWIKTDEYWHAGNTAPVIGICQMIVQLDPHFVEAYSIGAWVAEQQGNNKQALEFYKLGMERNPDNYDLPLQLGLELLKRDPEASLPYLKRAAELPSPVPVKRAYAHALTKAGKTKEAAVQWFKILQKYPNDPIATRELQRLQKAGKAGPEHK